MRLVQYMILMSHVAKNQSSTKNLTKTVHQVVATIDIVILTIINLLAIRFNNLGRV